MVTSTTRTVTLAGNGTFQIPSGTYTVNTNISGGGTLIAAGSGTLTLPQANSYTGGTTINNGSTLALTTTGSVATSTGVTANGTFDITGITGASSSITDLAGSGAVSLAAKRLILTNPSSTFSGAISGVGGTLTKQGSGTFTLSGPNTYTGGTTLSAGQITVGNNSGLGTGALTMASGTTLGVENGITVGNTINIPAASGNLSVASGTGTLSGTVTAGNTITKTGAGTLALSGTVGASDVIVSAGQLKANGTITVALANTGVDVQSGAILSGIGTIMGDVTIENGGTIQPGNTPGTMTIIGDLNLNSSSITTIEVTPTQSSEIQVSNTANLAGTLDVLVDPGTYSSPTTYTILTAGTVSNTFSSAQSSNPMFRVNVEYFPTQVLIQLILSGVSTSGLSGNSLKVASFLNSLPPSFVNSTPGLESVIAELANLSGSQLTDALIRISPTRNAFANFAMQNTMFSFTSVIKSRLAAQRALFEPGFATSVIYGMNTTPLPFKEDELLADASERLLLKTRAPEENYAVWVDGFGDFTHQDAKKQNPAFNANAGGVMAGFDFFRNCWLVGISAGYAGTSVRESENAGKANIDSYVAALYGTGYYRQFFLELSVLGSYNHFRESRNIVFPGFSEIARSKHKSGSITPHIGLGYDFEFCWSTIEPYASCDYVANFEEHYRETGAAPLNMSIKARNSSMLRSEGGVNFYQEARIGDCGIFVVREQLAYVNKRLFKTGKVMATIVGAPGFFTTTVLDHNQSLFAPALELFFKAHNGVFFTATYEGEFGSGYRANAAFGKLGYAF